MFSSFSTFVKAKEFLRLERKTILFLSKNHLLKVEKINQSVNCKMMILKRKDKVDNVTKNAFPIYNKNLH